MDKSVTQIEGYEFFVEQVKKFEGFRAKAYKPKGEKPSARLTIGYGTTFDPIGKLPVGVFREGDSFVISEESANALLNEHMDYLYTRLRLYTEPKIWDNLRPSQVFALLDMMYNCGESAYKNSSLRRLVNTEGASFHEIAKRFKLWTRSGGFFLQGLWVRCCWRARMYGMATGANVYELK